MGDLREGEISDGEVPTGCGRIVTVGVSFLGKLVWSMARRHRERKEVKVFLEGLVFRLKGSSLFA